MSNVTAFRNSDGRLRLTNFWDPLFRGGRGTGAGISDVRVTSDGGGFTGEQFTFSIGNGPTAVRSGAGCTHRLLVGNGLGKIIGWKLDGTSLQSNFERTRSLQLRDFGGIATKAALVVLDSPRRLVTGHLGFATFCRALRRDQGKPRLQLTVWDLNERDDAFVKVAEALLGGDYRDIGITKIASAGRQQRFAVALRGVRGELKVTTWGLT